MKCKYSMLLANTGLVAFLLAPPGALAQPASTLGSAASFGILGASTVTCTGAGAVTGDVGVSPGTAITGFTPTGTCTLTGTLRPGDGVAFQAHMDAGLAYFALAGQACDFTFAGVTPLEALPQPLDPGVYCFESAALLNGTVNLAGAGPWTFKIGSTLTTGGTPEMPAAVLVNNQPNCDGKDVFWLIGSSATIGVNTQLVGNILATASIGLDPGASLDGRALALNAAVTLSGQNTVSSVCGTGGSIPPPVPPGCRVKVICHDYHDKDCDHHDKDGDRCDKDCSGHHYKDCGSDKDCDKDKDGDHDKDGDKDKDGGKKGHSGNGR